MPLIPVPKTLLLLVLLSVISAGTAWGQTPRVYRLGGWTLITPADITPEALSAGPYHMPAPAAGVEFLAYWQDGSERALAVRFHGSDAGQDQIRLKSYHRTHRIKGCGLGVGSRIASLKKMLPKDAEPMEFPDGSAVLFSGNDRSLRRQGELLVIDQSTLRVQLSEDSALIRAGESDSGDFCVFELTREPEDEPQ